MLIPLSTVSKIGSLTKLFRRQATIISVPPRASESESCSKGWETPPSADSRRRRRQLLDLSRGILLAALTSNRPPSSLRHLQLVRPPGRPAEPPSAAWTWRTAPQVTQDRPRRRSRTSCEGPTPELLTAW